MGVLQSAQECGLRGYQYWISSAVGMLILLISDVLLTVAFQLGMVQVEDLLKNTGCHRIGVKQMRTVSIGAQGIPREQIRHYGFGFEGKKVLIGTDTKKS